MYVCVEFVLIENPFLFRLFFAILKSFFVFIAFVLYKSLHKILKLSQTQTQTEWCMELLVFVWFLACNRTS